MPGRKRNDYQGVRRKKGKQARRSFFLVVLQALASLVFFSVIILLDIFPMKYLLMLAIVLILLWSLALICRLPIGSRGALGNCCL